ncbi:MAG TPA: DUF6798 domain-containing protein, partial [Acidobacteriaceae bacterium]|nr:DUF6798 domain-containing protein [Acidobacteriaceae bacterium]
MLDGDMQVLEASPAIRRSSLQQHFFLLAISALTFPIHGYHPFADDAGLYVAGVEKLLDPTLFPVGMRLILSETRIESFYPLVIGVTKMLGGSMTSALLLLYLLTLVAFIYGTWYVSGLITECRFCRWIAVCLAGCFFTLPVAGTSINIMEPYLGPRSIVAMLSLFAVGLTLERRWFLLGLTLVASATMHPELAIFTGSFVLVLALLEHGKVRWAVGACGLAVMIAAALYAFTVRVAATAAYQAAQQSRTYIFLSEWHWYELLGVLLPLCLLAVAALRLRLSNIAGRLSVACVLAGTTSLVCSALFVHPAGPGLLARLQMLRMFQLIYIVGELLLGCGIGALFVKRGWGWREVGIGVLVPLAATMFFVQTAAFGHSNHLELPGMKPSNSYEQAFLWIRDNTPTTAVFAADPMLVLAPGEDEQNFRAMAQRSVLADYKDEGLALVFPGDAANWYQQFRAQMDIASMTDAQRIARLTPLGATWMVLPAGA